ncbi:hypothetical protein DL96DRAFT_1534676 [Flagelloscypha sp. PMI_526]|nr:hypothetical protein DL96DRAFT_1534676 [Flagelloscypha sp. PMI_526]
MSDDEHRAYLSAVQCLRDKPSQSELEVNGTKASSRFEDFEMVHIHKTDEGAIHNVAQFLGWHRYFLLTYETSLINECGYSGAQPYWNETKDAGVFAKSPILDGSNLSFGSSIGKGAGHCVNDGYFANAVNHLGPGYGAIEHCVTRNARDAWTAGQFSPSMDLTQKAFNECYSEDKFSGFSYCLETGPHATGHNVMSGEMTNVYSSPGDPLFYLHHGMVDFTYSYWQSQDSPARFYDLSGSSTEDGKTPITMDYELDLMGLAPSIPIRDIMNTEQAPVCYTYQPSS